MTVDKPVQVERVEYRQRSVRSRMSWLGLRVGVYPVIAAWSRIPERNWPYDLFDEMAGKVVPPLPRTFHEPVRLPHCDAELQIPEGARSDRALLYLHGGAFIVGGIGSHRRLAGSIAAQAQAQVLSVGYRKMPDHPPSVSVEDCFDAYLWLLDRGFTADQIVIAGDSAGGFLTAMVAVTLRDKGMAPPAGLICENPLIDPTPSRRREGAYRTADPLFPARAFTEFDRMIRESEPAGDAVAPLDVDLTGLPPTLVQVGSHETLRVDSEDFAAALAAVGVPVRLEIYRGAVHVFQAFIDVLPESRIAIAAMARFAVQRYTDAPAEAKAAAEAAAAAQSALIGSQANPAGALGADLATAVELGAPSPSSPDDGEGKPARKWRRRSSWSRSSRRRSDPSGAAEKRWGRGRRRGRHQ